MLGLLFAAVAWQAQIDDALHAPTLRGAHAAVLAVDAASGAVVYERNADDAFVPASTFKLVAGSAALERLTPPFVFSTDVDAAVPVGADGTLRGDLYLRGYGDAELSRADLDAAAAAVAAAGVRRIAGYVDGDATYFQADRYPGGWAVDDVPEGYAAIPGALGLELNVARVRVLPGSAEGSPATLQTDPPGTAYDIVNETTTGARGSDDTTDVARPWDKPRAIAVTGSYPLGAPLSDDLEPAVPDPETFALAAFVQALTRHGIAIENGTRDGAVPPHATVLWSHRSKPLAEILRDCWLPSNNLLAEQMLLEMGAQKPVLSASRARDTRADGIDVEKTWLRGIGVDPATLTIADGSGLSAYDRITPRALIAILQHDWNGSNREAVLAALPVSGVRGTLEHTFTDAPLQGAVYAKTGTTNHSRLLAGYLRKPGTRTIAFALMVNDWMDPSPHAHDALDSARSAILRALLSP